MPDGVISLAGTRIETGTRGVKGDVAIVYHA